MSPAFFLFVMFKKPLLISLGLYFAASALPALILHTGHLLGRGAWMWSGYESIRGANLLWVCYLDGSG